MLWIIVKWLKIFFGQLLNDSVKLLNLSYCLTSVNDSGKAYIPGVNDPSVSYWNSQHRQGLLSFLGYYWSVMHDLAVIIRHR